MVENQLTNNKKATFLGWKVTILGLPATILGVTTTDLGHKATVLGQFFRINKKATILGDS